MESAKVQFNKNSEERRKRRTKFLFIGLLILIIIIAGSVAFLRKESMQITQVQVVGVEALDIEAIEQSVYAALSGNYVWIIPKSNVLLFSKSNLEQQLLTTYPGIQQATVSFKNRFTLLITITEKQPLGVWCATETHCYFIDTSGIMYKSAPVFSDGIFIRFSGSVVPIDSGVIKGRFMDSEQFLNLKDLLGELKKYPVQVLTADINKSRDITMRIETIKGYTLSRMTKLLVTTESGNATILQNLDLLMRDKNFTSALVSRGKDLETIDFRFPGKIYYKFKNAGSSTQLDSATSTHE